MSGPIREWAEDLRRTVGFEPRGVVVASPDCVEVWDLFEPRAAGMNAGVSGPGQAFYVRRVGGTGFVAMAVEETPGVSRADAPLWRLISAAKALGACTLVSLTEVWPVGAGWLMGDMLVVTDHINCTGDNPLIGRSDWGVGPRFPDVSALYDRSLADLAMGVAKERGVNLRRGVLLGLPGRPADVPPRFWGLGADVAAAGGVAGALVAAQVGLAALGLAVVTRLAPLSAGLARPAGDRGRVRRRFREVVAGCLDRLVESE